MNVSTKELLFISNLQTKLATNFIDVGSKFNFHSEEFLKNREISSILDYFANSRYEYVDENKETVPIGKCLKGTDSLDRCIDFLRHRYRLGCMPYIDYPRRSTNIIYDLVGGGGSKLPDGGGPGYFLTKDKTGNLVWERLNDCLFKQTFITGPSTTNLPPYVFVLNSSPEKVHQIFINGVLFDREELYSLEGNVVTIQSPTVLHNAKVSIFAGCKSLNYLELFAEDYEENFIWNEGDSNTFELTYINLKLQYVFRNGQKLNKDLDTIYSLNTNEVTLLDPLEDGDEIDIIYRPSMITIPLPDKIFDFTFDETFE